MKIIRKFTEKLMEVPQDFLDDTENWLEGILASLLLYNINLTYQVSESHYLQAKNKEEEDGIPVPPKKVENFRRMSQVLQNAEKLPYNKSYMRRFKTNSTFSKSFRLDKYTSKYGDLSDIAKSITIKFKTGGLEKQGMFSPKTSNINLYVNRFAHTLKELSDQKVILFDKYLLIMGMMSLSKLTGGNIDEINFYWKYYKDFPEIIKDAVESYRYTLEHEFIHFIQFKMFRGKIVDPAYSTKDTKRYLLSPYEQNPFIVSNFNDFTIYLKKEKLEPTRDVIEQWVQDQYYFNYIKDWDYSVYKKVLKDFYQIVDERLGVI